MSTTQNKEKKLGAKSPELRIHDSTREPLSGMTRQSYFSCYIAGMKAFIMRMPENLREGRRDKILIEMAKTNTKREDVKRALIKFNSVEMQGYRLILKEKRPITTKPIPLPHHACPLKLALNQMVDVLCERYTPLSEIKMSSRLYDMEYTLGEVAVKE